ncbi:hypothetical protein CHH34_00205 [Aeromonas veronii]|uniref:Uncharacterized protein n=1 Tax=Aeromonas veronii TaxID=654 RepID=A0ABY3MG95_AERVE|nr:hypothetical protein CGZ72_21135 [Aeromonas veronii]RDU78820.1 hypothetical protein CGZ76_21460 [Aeromonas veronii]RDU86133.1 hypothetical protein CHF44_01745 [Aeromonas veronii]RDU94343.1 hypothetical protein CHH34_00205 [Aeromonas veronii]TEY45026.1 hypothetical protein CIG14_21180 [Aeromonas veronii]
MGCTVFALMTEQIDGQRDNMLSINSLFWPKQSSVLIKVNALSERSLQAYIVSRPYIAEILA